MIIWWLLNNYAHLGRLNLNTSRKHCKKEPQSFFHCGSFDHLDLQSLKWLHIVFLGLPTYILWIMGLLKYRWKGLENTFPAVYYMPPLKKNCSCKTKKKILQSFSDCRSRWSKEPQWKNNCSSFLQCFLLVKWVDFSSSTYILSFEWKLLVWSII
jgi:hypothetical protein